MEIKKVNITVDGKKFEVLPDRNLLHVLLALGFDIPHFCFHPALGSVGACRSCAVRKYRDENDQKGRIVMSCMEPVADGLIISVEEEGVRDFRKSICESLMINHPHDCPVCDEGGECHLQDMTLMTGDNYRRYNFRKRTFNNQYLGPFINHEMNRCIQCYRCVRFYKDYAGGKDLNVYGCHDKLYFGRYSDGMLENEFSGNLAEVCPTGVFTDKTLGKHYARKWDMTNAPSICVHCSVGCNIIVCQRYTRVIRIRNRYNGQVNWDFICDRGRFGYEFINSDNRLRHILIRSSQNGMEVADEETLKERMTSFFTEKDKVIGIGSPRASLESNFALLRMVGKENFYSGISVKDKTLMRKAIDLLSSTAIHTPSLRELEKSDAILILGENVTDTAPMIALALRQAIRNVSFEMAREKNIPVWQDDAVRINADRAKSPMFILTPTADKLDEVSWKSIRLSPQEIERMGFAIASFLNENAPKVENLKEEERKIAEEIAHQLRNAKNPLILSGVHLREGTLLDVSALIAHSLSKPEIKPNLCLVFTECNSVGLELLEGQPLEDAFQRIKQQDDHTVIILENNLFMRADEEETEKFFDKCNKVIALDHLSTDTTAMADVILPVGTFAESTGTIVNNEGRAQRFYTDIPQHYPVLDSWRWIGFLNKLLNQEAEKPTFQQIVSDISEYDAVFKNLRNLSDEQATRMLNEKIARQTPRFSGRTAITANENVIEPPPPKDPDSHLAFSMEGRREFPPSTLVPYYWSPGWNSVQAFYKYMDEPNGSLLGGDPGIRLLDELKSDRLDNYQVPSAFNASNENLLIVPVYRIYGSEELSSRGEAIKERISPSTLYLNSSDANRLGIKTEEEVELIYKNNIFSVKADLDDRLPLGVAGIFRKLTEIPFLDLPGWGKVQKKGV